jgi:Signal transduction histidine kinase
MEANARLEETVGLRTRELVAARDRAEMADRSKTAFLSTVSHELRTPLNSIIGFTDVVLQELSGPLNEEQKRQLGIVQESSRMLLGLINEILDLSRIEAGRLQLDFESFDLSELLRKRVEAFASIAEQKRIALECRVDDTVGIIFSDPKRVAQIVTNLLSNATKFTVAGSVALHARRVHDNVEIDVRDTGPGICSDDLALLFRPFMQVGEAQRSHREGTGLGLVISRHLAHALGGDIGVSSVVGQGTVFTITLPVRSSPQPDDLGDTGLFHKLVTPA